MKLSPALVVLANSVLLAQTPELIRGLGAMNAASFAAEGLPAAGVAPGARFVLFGRALGPAEPVTQENPTETLLAGVTVSVSSGTSTVNAPVLSVGPDRIEAMLPLDTALGEATVTVKLDGATLRTNIRVVERAFGIRTAGRQGRGRAMVAETVRAGSLVRLRGTGLGREASPVGLEVLVGGLAQPAAGVARLSGGWEEIDFEVPATIAPGCEIPVAVRHGATVSNFASIDIGDDCPASNSDAAEAPVSAGALSLIRSEAEYPGVRSVNEVAAGWFQKGPAGADGLTGITPGRGCTVYYAVEQDQLEPQIAGLDAGRLVVNGPLGVREIERQSKGAYASPVGQVMEGLDIPATPGTGLFLTPGDYTISGSGGADVGPFSARIAVPEPAVWSNPNHSLDRVDRSTDLTIEWRGATEAQLVTVSGFSTVAGSRPAVAAGFTCVERGDQGRLTVPAFILSALPATTSREADAMLTFGVDPLRPAEFTAAGLDRPGRAGYSQAVLRTTQFR